MEALLDHLWTILDEEATEENGWDLDYDVRAFHPSSHAFRVGSGGSFVMHSDWITSFFPLLGCSFFRLVGVVVMRAARADRVAADRGAGLIIKKMGRTTVQRYDAKFRDARDVRPQQTAAE